MSALDSATGWSPDTASIAANVGWASSAHRECLNRMPTTYWSGSSVPDSRRSSKCSRSRLIASSALRASIRSSRPSVYDHCVKCVWQSHKPGMIHVFEALATDFSEDRTSAIRPCSIVMSTDSSDPTKHAFSITYGSPIHPRFNKMTSLPAIVSKQCLRLPRSSQSAMRALNSSAGIRLSASEKEGRSYPLIHCLPEAGRQRGDISSTLALWTMEHNIRKASHG